MKTTTCILLILLGVVLPASTIGQAGNPESPRAAQKDWKKHLKQEEKAKKKAQKKAQSSWKKQHQTGNQ